MVKIRLKRQGNKHRPFYRIVVAKADSGRDSAAIEFLGTYNPLTRPSTVTLKNDRALHWLMNGAQPTETVAIILDRAGVLADFFVQRPSAKANYKFLDKRTAAMSQQSVVSATAVAEPVAAAPVAEAAPAAEAVAEEPAAVEEAPAAEAEAEA
ncbi:MAG: 30S ribosomal protein S16 [Armatimonadetes bacterium]|nr:30S ribosomal protein S16 [Armatimonadota bacterium]